MNMVLAVLEVRAVLREAVGALGVLGVPGAVVLPGLAEARGVVVVMAGLVEVTAGLVARAELDLGEATQERRRAADAGWHPLRPRDTHGCWR